MNLVKNIIRISCFFGLAPIILTYSTNRNQDLIAKLERGAYSSVRYYVNPVSFKPSISVFKSDDYLGKANNLGEKEIELPKINDDSDLTLGDLPSRIFVGMLDVGTLEKDASDEGWNDPVKRNADPQRIHSQSMMRYNQIFSIKTQITIPGDFSIKAGDLVTLDVPELKGSPTKELNPESGGIYMVASVCHRVTPGSSLTSLDLVRDSYGKKATGMKS